MSQCVFPKIGKNSYLISWSSETLRFVQVELSCPCFTPSSSVCSAPRRGYLCSIPGGLAAAAVGCWPLEVSRVSEKNNPGIGLAWASYASCFTARSAWRSCRGLQVNFFLMLGLPSIPEHVLRVQNVWMLRAAEASWKGRKIVSHPGSFDPLSRLKSWSVYWPGCGSRLNDGSSYVIM